MRNVKSLVLSQFNLFDRRVASEVDEKCLERHENYVTPAEFFFQVKGSPWTQIKPFYSIIAHLTMRNLKSKSSTLKFKSYYEGMPVTSQRRLCLFLCDVTIRSNNCQFFGKGIAESLPRIKFTGQSRTYGVPVMKLSMARPVF